MTKKEAIMILESIQPSCGEKYSFSESEIYEAIDMAIEALSRSEIPNTSEPKCADGCIYGWGSSECGHCDYRSEEPKTGDCISRQAAIDAINKIKIYRPLDSDRYVLSDCLDKIVNLPPAQPEPIRINLNEPIKVKLTDLGKEIYYHQYDRINQIVGREACKPSFPKEDENGYTEFQLWCFMELYGEHMGMTLPNVIEPLEIVYER